MRYLLFSLIVLSGCSLKKMAMGTMSGVFADAEAVFLADEDPQLVGEALPFTIKTMETLLDGSPESRDLLLSLTTVTTLYAYGFVEPQARAVEDEDLEQAIRIRARASRLCLRAWRYALRGLEVAHPDLGERLSRQPSTTVKELDGDDLALTVWGASALGAAISIGKDNPELTADIAVVGALLQRALELDGSYRDGIVHELMMSYELSRFGGSLKAARRHYDAAVALNRGGSCALLVSWAEGYCVRQQKRKEFEQIIDQVRSFNIGAFPERRLLNLLAQHRAEWLDARKDELFLE